MKYFPIFLGLIIGFIIGVFTQRLSLVTAIDSGVIVHENGKVERKVSVPTVSLKRTDQIVDYVELLKQKSSKDFNALYADIRREILDGKDRTMQWKLFLDWSAENEPDQMVELMMLEKFPDSGGFYRSLALKHPEKVKSYLDKGLILNKDLQCIYGGLVESSPALAQSLKDSYRENRLVLAQFDANLTKQNIGKIGFDAATLEKLQELKGPLGTQENGNYRFPLSARAIVDSFDSLGVSQIKEITSKYLGGLKGVEDPSAISAFGGPFIEGVARRDSAAGIELLKSLAPKLQQELAPSLVGQLAKNDLNTSLEFIKNFKSNEATQINMLEYLASYAKGKDEDLVNECRELSKELEVKLQSQK